MRRATPAITVVMPMTDVSGGAERALLAFLEGNQARRSVQSVVFLEAPGPLSFEVGQLGYLVRHEPVTRLRQVVSLARAVARTVRAVRQDRSTVVLTWMTRAAPVGHLAARLTGVAHLIYQHGPTGVSSYERLVFGARPDGVLVCSAYCADSLAALHPKVPYSVVWPGLSSGQLDQARSGRSRARALLGIDESAQVVGTVARLQAWKGTHHLLAAAAHLGDGPGALQIIIVGGAPAGARDYEEQLVRQAEALHPSVRAELVGPSPDGSRWIAAFDAFVHSAAGEPFGLVIAEAMAAQTAVVAAATGGPRELLADGEFGALVDPADSVALAAAITRALKPTAARGEMLQRAAGRVAALEPDAFAERVLEACSSLTVHRRELAR